MSFPSAVSIAGYRCLSYVPIPNHSLPGSIVTALKSLETRLPQERGRSCFPSVTRKVTTHRHVADHHGPIQLAAGNALMVARVTRYTRTAVGLSVRIAASVRGSWGLS